METFKKWILGNVVQPTELDSFQGQFSDFQVEQIPYVMLYNNQNLFPVMTIFPN
jgi:hypothetical protein